jgi:hypothetical protein
MGCHRVQQWWLANGIGRFQLVRLSSWLVDPFEGQGVPFEFFFGPFILFLIIIEL